MRGHGAYCAPGEHTDVEVTEVGQAYRDFMCTRCSRYRTEPLPDTPLQPDVDDDEGDHRG